MRAGQVILHHTFNNAMESSSYSLKNRYLPHPLIASKAIEEQIEEDEEAKTQSEDEEAVLYHQSILVKKKIKNMLKQVDKRKHWLLDSSRFNNQLI